MKQKITYVEKQCAFCPYVGRLAFSHAIPRSAFIEMLNKGSGKAISIPNANGIAGYTQDCGAAPLLCVRCEGDFNKRFDGPMANALKELAQIQDQQGALAEIEFSANQMAHAMVSIAWRMCASPAQMYADARLAPEHLAEVERILRLPSSDVLKNCSVRIARIRDATPQKDGGFSIEAMRQFIKSPQIFSLMSNRGNRTSNFAIDWTMFGFLIQVIFPALNFQKRKVMHTLKRGEQTIRAIPIGLFEWQPVTDALVLGYAAIAEERVSKGVASRPSLPST